MEFLSQYGLIIVLVLLLVFMFWSSRRRMAKQKLEQEAKARQTIPGAEVLLQGGLYGTIVAYDPDNLDQPAVVEIAPGVDIKVHSQAILRVITPTEPTFTEDDLPAEEAIVHEEIPAHDAPAIEVEDAPAKPAAGDPDSENKPNA